MERSLPRTRTADPPARDNAERSKSDVTAVAPADDAGFAHAELVHEGDDIVGHQVVAEGAGIASRTAMAATVDKDHTIALCKRADLIAPILTVYPCRAWRKISGGALVSP